MLQMQERTVCYLCGRSLATPAPHRSAKSWEPLTTGTSFEVAVCLPCGGLGHTTPYPSEDALELLYGKADSTSRDLDVIRGNWIDRAKDWNAARTMKRRALRHLDERPQTVVDFGSGNGRFATIVHSMLPDAKVYAVDFQESRPLGITDELPYLTVEQFLQTHVCFDLIWCRHVLEHSLDPVTLLRELANKLSPTGRIYIEVPNLDSTMARVAGKRWAGYYVPLHIFHYTPSSLAAVLSRAGLEGNVVKCEVPLMGIQLKEWLGQTNYGPLLQVAGAALHPVQLMVEAAGRSSGCLMVLTRPTVSRQ